MSSHCRQLLFPDQHPSRASSRRLTRRTASRVSFPDLLSRAPSVDVPAAGATPRDWRLGRGVNSDAEAGAPLPPPLAVSANQRPSAFRLPPAWGSGAPHQPPHDARTQSSATAAMPPSRSLRADSRASVSRFQPNTNVDVVAEFNEGLAAEEEQTNLALFLSVAAHAWPNIVSSVFLLLPETINIFVIARYADTDALAAVGMGNFLLNCTALIVASGLNSALDQFGSVSGATLGSFGGATGEIIFWARMCLVLQAVFFFKKTNVLPEV